VAQVIIRRLTLLIPLLFIVSLIVFGLLLIIPGDPASVILGDQATPEQIATVRERLGLDDPIPVRYGRWLGDVLRGDLGTSLFSSYAVTQAILDRLPVTLSLVGVALLLAIVIGIPAGVVAGARPGSLIDRILTIGTSAGVAMPNFWLGLILSLVVGIKLGWLPATGFVRIGDSFTGWLSHITLPALTLAAASAAELVRQTRAGMIEVLEQDYIRTARSKGLRELSILTTHALKNAMVPVITVAGLTVSRLFALSAIVEQIFGLEGVGSLAIRSVFNRDLPMLQGIVLMATVVVLFTNLIVDISYSFFNPSVRAT
jgi:peptide/nickel transport system permease protein